MRQYPDVAIGKNIVSYADPNINLPISHGATQVGLCLLFACAGLHNALEGIRKPLPIRNISHSPPPPPPMRGRRGASRTAVVIVSSDGSAEPAPRLDQL